MPGAGMGAHRALGEAGPVAHGGASYPGTVGSNRCDLTEGDRRRRCPTHRAVDSLP